MSVDFSGEWTAELHKSRLLGPVPRAISVQIEQSSEDLREELTITGLDGAKQHLVFACRINCESENSLDGRAVRSRATWQGEELIIESWMQSGAREMYFCDCWSLSSDGQTLSMEHRNDDLAGQLTILQRVK